MTRVGETCILWSIILPFLCSAENMVKSGQVMLPKPSWCRSYLMENMVITSSYGSPLKVPLKCWYTIYAKLYMHLVLTFKVVRFMFFGSYCIKSLLILMVSPSEDELPSYLSVVLRTKNSVIKIYIQDFMYSRSWTLKFFWDIFEYFDGWSSLKQFTTFLALKRKKNEIFENGNLKYSLKYS